MIEDRRKKAFKKKKRLEEVYQNLYQAEARGDKLRVKIWKDIIKKLESEDADNKNTI